LEDEDAEIAPQEQEGITLAEKMDLWKTEKPVDDGEENISEEPDGYIVAGNMHHSETETPALGREDDYIALDENDEAEEDEDEDYAITHFPEAWQFLTSSHAYYWLLARVRTELLLTKRIGTSADNIRREILKGLTSRSRKNGYGQTMIKVTFQISWSLPQFLKQQYPEEDFVKLGSLITLVSSEDDVQALTCAQYMSQVWPVTGSDTLAALQGALDKGPGQPFKGRPIISSSLLR